MKFFFYVRLLALLDQLLDKLLLLLLMLNKEVFINHFKSNLSYNFFLNINISFLLASAIGDCTKDSFRVASQGLSGSPVICGFNTGQHSKYILFRIKKLRQNF